MSDATTRRWATGIAIGSVAVLAATALALYLSGGRLASPAYATGQRVDLPASLYSGATRTLLVIAQSSCAGCQAAKPFLTQLVADMRGVAQARVAVVVERSDADAQAFAAEIGVTAAEVVGVDLHRYSVRRVPTVLVVDATGGIRFSLENAPAAAQQTELLLRYRDALR